MATLQETIRDFKADLETIDPKNIDYFLFEPEEKNEGERDKLENHCKLKMQGDKSVFGFYMGSAVPMRNRNQCFAKFEHYIPDGGIAGGIWSK